MRDPSAPSGLRLSYGAASRMTKCESGIEREHKHKHKHKHEHEHEMRGRRSTTAYHSVSGKRERLPYNGFQIVDPVLLHALCSAPQASSRPGDKAELVVLLQMGMCRQDADAEAVGAGFARRN